MILVSFKIKCGFIEFISNFISNKSFRFFQRRGKNSWRDQTIWGVRLPLWATNVYTLLARWDNIVTNQLSGHRRHQPILIGRKNRPTKSNKKSNKKLNRMNEMEIKWVPNCDSKRGPKEIHLLSRSDVSDRVRSVEHFSCFRSVHFRSVEGLVPDTGLDWKCFGPAFCFRLFSLARAHLSFASSSLFAVYSSDFHFHHFLLSTRPAGHRFDRIWFGLLEIGRWSFCQFHSNSSPKASFSVFRVRLFISSLEFNHQPTIVWCLESNGLQQPSVDLAAADSSRFSTFRQHLTRR